MTEQKAIETLKCMELFMQIMLDNEVLENAIKRYETTKEEPSSNATYCLLKELKRYRELGTLEEIEELVNELMCQRIFKKNTSDEVCLNQSFSEDDSIKDFTDDLLNMGYTKGKKDGYNQALEDFADEMLSVCAEYDSYILEIKNQLTK